jgi:hypothetical protein
MRYEFGEWVPTYTAAQANSASDQALQTNMVFRQCPAELFQTNVPPQTANALLAKGIPALSAAVGLNGLSAAGLDRNYNMNAASEKPNGWGRNDDDYGTRWLHSDFKNMAFFYVHMLYDKLVDDGGLR